MQLRNTAYRLQNGMRAGVGDMLSYTFTGTDIGIYMGIWSDSGMIAFSIDGGAWCEKDN